MERDTAQRRAIRTVFDEHPRPLAPAEVLEYAQAEAPKLGIATVYRTLKGLVDEQWLKPVELPGEPARYERTGLAHHHHFHCRACNRVFDIQGCAKAVSALAPGGFTVEAHEILLYGHCASCASRNAGSSGRRGQPRHHHHAHDHEHD